MELSEPVKKILSFYESDNPGTKANLARILLQGKLGGTGRLLILPVDQGDVNRVARQMPSALQTAESAANHHHVRALVVHIIPR